MKEAPASTFMAAILRGANESVQDLNYEFFLWPRNLGAAFTGRFQWVAGGIRKS